MTSRNAAIVVLLAATIACGRTPASDTTASTTAQSDAPGADVTFVDYGFGGDFTLTDQDGQPFSLTNVRGKHALIFFGYTMCPDICPMTLSRIAAAFEALPASARDQVVTLFVSVDVDRDTPPVLAEYVKSFDVPLIGLTGSRDDVDKVVDQYHASYEITPTTSAAGVEVTHSTYTYLIDPNGKLVYLFRHDDDPATIAKVIGKSIEVCAPAAD